MNKLYTNARSTNANYTNARTSQAMQLNTHINMPMIMAAEVMFTAAALFTLLFVPPIV
jgi:hypothetical protein